MKLGLGGLHVTLCGGEDVYVLSKDEGRDRKDWGVGGSFGCSKSQLMARQSQEETICELRFCIFAFLFLTFAVGNGRTQSSLHPSTCKNMSLACGTSGDSSQQCLKQIPHALSNQVFPFTF